jgi:hypothetical protein
MNDHERLAVKMMPARKSGNAIPGSRELSVISLSTLAEGEMRLLR